MRKAQGFLLACACFVTTSMKACTFAALVLPNAAACVVTSSMQPLCGNVWVVEAGMAFGGV